MCFHHHQTSPEEKKDVGYTFPMHPSVHETVPGQCPECGMNLVPEKKKEGSAHGTGTHAC
jgi:hypothetical protein